MMYTRLRRLEYIVEFEAFRFLVDCKVFAVIFCRGDCSLRMPRL